MTARIFATVGRGITDKTAVCIFPWELPILERIHADQVEEVSIEQMCSLKGAIKVEKNKVKVKRVDPNTGKEVTPETPPDLRTQLETMCHVDPDDDPTEDPSAEYGRMVDKYGMDKEVNLPVVSVVYGQENSGAFGAALKQASRGKTPQGKGAAGPDPVPQGLGEYQGKPISEMSINELRTALRSEKIDFEQTAKKAELADLLATATA